MSIHFQGEIPTVFAVGPPPYFALRHMGRNRKPAAIKLLTGSNGRDAGNRKIQEEPEPEGEVKRPRGLRGRALEYWNEYAPILTAMGTLKSPDGPSLAIWCKYAAMAEREFRKMSVAQLAEMRRIGDGFGCSATGRARIGKEPPKGKRDKAEDYFPATG